MRVAPVPVVLVVAQVALLVCLCGQIVRLAVLGAPVSGVWWGAVAMVAASVLMPRFLETDRDESWVAGLVVGADVAMVALVAHRSADVSLFVVVPPACAMSALFGWRGTTLVPGGFTVFWTAPALALGAHDGAAVFNGVAAPLVALGAGVLAAWVTDRFIGAYQAAAERYQELLAVLDSVEVGVVFVDSDGHIGTVNQKQRELLDAVFPGEVPQVVGDAGHTYLDDGLTAVAAERLPSARALMGEEFRGQLLRLGDPAGEQLVVMVSSRTVWSVDGQSRGAVLSYLDITELVRAQDAERHFLALVSHELRTPLTSIRGYAELIRDEAVLDQQASLQLEVIERNAERLGRLISNILILSGPAVDDEMSQRFIGPLDVVQEAKECIAGRLPSARAVKVDIALDGVESARIFVRPSRMRLILDNLLEETLTNASHDTTIVVSIIEGDGYVQINIGVRSKAAEFHAPPAVVTVSNRAMASKASSTAPSLRVAAARRCAEALGGDLRVIEPRDGDPSVCSYVVCIPHRRARVPANTSRLDAHNAAAVAAI